MKTLMIIGFILAFLGFIGLRYLSKGQKADKDEHRND